MNKKLFIPVGTHVEAICNQYSGERQVFLTKRDWIADMWFESSRRGWVVFALPQISKDGWLTIRVKKEDCKFV